MLKHIRNVKFDIIKVSYNAFVISDVCNRSLCVIPFVTGQKSRAFTIQLDLIMDVLAIQI